VYTKFRASKDYFRDRRKVKGWTCSEYRYAQLKPITTRSTWSTAT